MPTVGRGRREKDKSLLSQMQFDANLEQAILIPSRLLRGWVGGWTLNGLKAQFAPGSNLIVSTAVARHRAVKIFSIIRREVSSLLYKLIPIEEEEEEEEAIYIYAVSREAGGQAG